MSYQEKDFQRELRHKHNEVYTFASEQKISKSKSIRFDAVQDHQIEFLLQVVNGEFFYKFNDFYIKGKTLKKPFDSFFLGKGLQDRAFIIIMFYTQRKKKNVYWIPVFDWLSIEEEFRLKGRKSIKEEELKKYSWKIQDFTKKSY